MKFFLGKSSQNTVVDRIRVNKDYYEFNKTILHGFPARPTCIAYDNYHKLLAIGTKNGCIQIYGKPGVEFHYEFETEEVKNILFVPKKGQLVVLCSDFSLHLLQITSKRDQYGIHKLYHNNHFVLEDNPSTNETITVINLSLDGKTLFIGTNTGNVSLLEIQTFTLLDQVIKQETVVNSKPEELKFKPGSVEAIEEQPNNKGKILIGYNRSLIALWDYVSNEMVNHFIIEQTLESLSWRRDGKHFITSHNDGSYITWNSTQESHLSSGKLPYGPFPCKAITKILWDTTDNGEFFFFSGGMPRSAHSDKEVVSIIFQNFENVNQEKNHVLDFTSKVVDFLVISSESHNPEALIVLVDEEIVAIDLTHPEWLQFKLPYLSCLHSSSITCSQHYCNVNKSVYNQILEAGKSETNVKYASIDWPVKGGISKYQSANETHDILLTGHEDGTVRFWDASTTSLKHLYTLSTSKIFNSNEDDIALIDSDDNDLNDCQNEWPPFRKVGNFDPYSDDPKLAIRKISFCPLKGVLVVGGTAGQVITFEFSDKPSEYSINSYEMRIIDDKDGFVWKGHGILPLRSGSQKFGTGYQITSLLQIHPPAAVTALTISTQWQVIGAGTAHGFGLFDYTSKSLLVHRTTLKQSNISAVAGGDALISRRKSFKKSLRESFRRLRKGRSQKSKRGANQTKVHELIKGIKYDDADAKPVERQIEARTEDMMSSMVRYLYFCSAVIINNTLYPTFWVGTNSGTVFIFVLTSDKNSSNQCTWQLAKEVQLKHKAPIIFIRLIDSQGALIFENNTLEQDKHSHSRVLICSEEQFKLFTLPNFKTLHKFKLTAHEGARVRRLDLGHFVNKSNENQTENSIMCLTNQGDVSIFSLFDFKRKYQNHFIKKEDINAITSLIFTKYGEGFYLKSSSEYQRFSLSSKRTNFPECFIQLCEEEEDCETKEVEVCETSDDIKNEEPEMDNDESAVVITTEVKKELQVIPDVTQNESKLNDTTESIINHLSEINEDKPKNGIPNSSPNKVVQTTCSDEA